MFDKEKVKTIVEEFLNYLQFSDDVKVNINEEVYILNIDLDTSNAKDLIGREGRTLASLQHLLRKVISKKIDKDILIELDVNDYKKEKKEQLRDIAQDFADEAVRTKKEKIISNMSPFSRRIIHLELEDRNDVSTESVGEGEDRKLVIKPL